jgi:hypothetical protein
MAFVNEPAVRMRIGVAASRRIRSGSRAFHPARALLWGPGTMSKSPLSLLLFSFVALTGCYNSGVSGRHSFAMEMCRANIPVYPPGQVPPVPYQMIAPVDSRWGISATSRFEHMKAHACELGADAIIDTADRYPQTSSVTTTTQYDVYGRPVAVQALATNAASRSTPIAIKFLAAPLAQVAMMQPPPNVTFVAPPQTITIVQPPPDVSVVQAAPTAD